MIYNKKKRFLSRDSVETHTDSGNKKKTLNSSYIQRNIQANVKYTEL